MPDVISLAPADVRMFVSLDVHKLSIVAATLPPAGGQSKIALFDYWSEGERLRPRNAQSR
jgi:hypothetical protein